MESFECEHLNNLWCSAWNQPQRDSSCLFWSVHFGCLSSPGHLQYWWKALNYRSDIQVHPAPVSAVHYIVWESGVLLIQKYQDFNTARQVYNREYGATASFSNLSSANSWHFRYHMLGLMATSFFFSVTDPEFPMSAFHQWGASCFPSAPLSWHV